MEFVKMGGKNIHFNTEAHFQIERRGIKRAGCQNNKNKQNTHCNHLKNQLVFSFVCDK